MTDETRFRASRAMANPQPVPQGTGGRGVRRFEDPLAELARLIGQDDPFADFVATKPVPERRRSISEGRSSRQEPRHEERDYHAREQRDLHDDHDHHDEHEPEHREQKNGNGSQHFAEEPEGAPHKQNGSYRETGFDDHDLNGHADPIHAGHGHGIDEHPAHEEFDLPPQPVNGRQARPGEAAPRQAQYRYGQKPEQDFAPQPQQARNRFTPPAHDDYDYPEDGYAQPQAPRQQQRGNGPPQNGRHDQPRNGYAKNNGYADPRDAYYEDDRYAEQEAYAEQPRQPKRAPAKSPANPVDDRAERDPRAKHARKNGKDYDAAYDDAHLPAHLDEYYDEAPKKSGKKWILISAAAACILVLGVTGVVGYRAVFGTSSAPKTIKAEGTPAKVAPVANTQSEPGKNNDRVGFDAPPGQERVVSRQEEPVGRSSAPSSSPFAPAPQQQVQTPQPARQQAQAPVAEGEPKRVRTVSVRADGSVVGDQRANSQRQVSNSPMNINSYAERETGSAPAQQAMPSPQTRAPAQQSTAPAPSSGNPWADIPSAQQRSAPPAQQQQAAVQPSSPPPVQRAPAPTIAVNSPMPAGSYVVQVASQKTEQEAQTAWQQVQQRYASVLGGQQAQIRRANLGERGTFYRAQLGPFNDRARASEICENLKAAGGECIIQRN